MIKENVVNSRTYRSFNESVLISREEIMEIIDTARFCPSARNLQPLRYRIVTDPQEIEDMIDSTKWGGALPQLKLPPDGHHPSAFIVICCDSTVSEVTPECFIDVGIAAQTMMLCANDMGFGGCMLRSFTPATISQKLLIPKKYTPLLILALGTPDETVFICNVNSSGDTTYYRDKIGLHFVPKRSLDDIIIE